MPLTTVCYTSSMRTIERNIAGAFIFSNDGFVLIGKNHKGGVFEDMWVVPGGGIDEGETAEEAMRREILEEVGIDVAGAQIEEQPNIQSATSEKTLRDTGERVNVRMYFTDFVVTIDKPASEIAIILEDDFGFAEWTSINDLSGKTFSLTTKSRFETLGLL